MDVATREVLAARQRSRREHRPGPGRRLEQAYVGLLALAVLGSMLVSGSAGLLDGSGCSGAAGCLDPAGRPALASAVALAGWALLWRTAVSAGPVGSSRAEVSWLLSTPAERRVLLLPAATRAAVLGAATGGLLGWLVLSALDVSGARPVAGAVTAGALAGLATAACAVCRQPARRGPASPAPGRLVLVAAAAFAAAALVPLVPPAAAATAAARDPHLVWLGAVGLALVLAVGCSGVALRRLDRVPLPELVAAGDVQEGVHGSVVMLDATYAASRLRSRLRQGGRARSRRGRGGGPAALLHRELLVAVRRHDRLLVAAGLLLVPALVQVLAGSTLAVVVAVLVGLRVARSVSGSLRTVGGSGGLARSLPFSVLETTTLLLVVPAAVVGGWSLLVAVVLGLPGWAAVSLAAAALAGVVRGASPPDGTGTGPMVMTEAGPVPLGLVGRTVRGPDVVLVAVAPLLLGLGPVASLVLPLVLLAALVERGSRGR